MKEHTQRGHRKAARNSVLVTLLISILLLANVGLSFASEDSPGPRGVEEARLEQHR